MAGALPVASRMRVDVLDVLRGAAIFGILLYNAADFTGYEFLTEAQRAALPWSGLDGPVTFAREWLVQGKFYSLFSLLFGVGLALQLPQDADAFTRRRIRRRLAILLVIGTAHGVGLWFGDILQTYAVLGFVLLLWHARPVRSVGRWALALLAAPIVIYGVLLAGILLLASPAPAPAADAVEGLPPVIEQAFDAMPNGSYADVVKGNAVISAMNWVRRLIIMALPRILGMFLLGMWLVRSGWLTRLARPGPDELAALARVAWWGLAIGLPLAWVGAWFGDSSAPRLPTPGGWLEIAAESIATPALCLAYAALIVRAYAAAPGAFLPVAAVGRMALSNYLAHSVLGVALFYGIGLGYWGQLALVPTLLGACGLYAVQMAVSLWWLRRARYGPAEWIWRQGTYGRRLPLWGTSAAVE
jgi:uncharacterized protein